MGSQHDTSLFDCISIPGKGYGLLATNDISPGTVIFQEGPIMRIDKPGSLLTEDDVSAAFDKLSTSEQEAIMALNEDKKLDRSRLMGIFKSNTFGNNDACWIHPTICRINHSCVPNTVTATDPCCIGDEVQVFAEKPIKAGEEITLSYNHQLYEITTARQRAVLLQRQYGFACDCPACAEGSAFRTLSDQRRLLIKELRQSLNGLQTSDFSILDNAEPTSHAAKAIPERALWVKEETPKTPIPPARRAAYNILQAKLRQVEGLPARDIAMNYWQAAEAMLQQILDMQTIVILSWAKAVRVLMEKAMGVMDAVRSPFDHDPQALREAWKAMQGRPCMRVGLSFLDGELEIPEKRRKRHADRRAWAVQIVKGGELRVLSRRELKEVLERGGEDDGGASAKSAAKEAAAAKSWHGKVREQVKDSGTVYKVLGATVTCAVPLAAWWILR
ncbi:SET domain-containing protein 5 [Fulvia fulva]|uniref:SET domain-containing protein 5 n=1 Tax=Passalora fulva TaxID=5499 RepID=A0A9Q8PLZ5_PASFU|nr:SET domain-containing protein 5 [Fulvia fulva]KAK4610197.1 SET domain-containing protein 5 [Fulvia fulva]KAK4610958.1 SET domain-containing protein 5 [Fulvia fulva]UJO24832.1 SET domain-containing protein 5 [Fulvia fulva]WPV21702.1 SET domain-containing protein 5 [Fulvia fulva]WPV36641.1 SET domain-containing protein 5 [Fulvia fulva]